MKNRHLNAVCLEEGKSPRNNLARGQFCLLINGLGCIRPAPTSSDGSPTAAGSQSGPRNSRSVEWMDSGNGKKAAGSGVAANL